MSSKASYLTSQSLFPHLWNVAEGLWGINKNYMERTVSGMRVTVGAGLNERHHWWDNYNGQTGHDPYLNKALQWTINSTQQGPPSPTISQEAVSAASTQRPTAFIWEWSWRWPFSLTRSFPQNHSFLPPHTRRWQELLMPSHPCLCSGCLLHRQEELSPVSFHCPNPAPSPMPPVGGR